MGGIYFHLHYMVEDNLKTNVAIPFLSVLINPLLSSFSYASSALFTSSEFLAVLDAQ